MLIVKSAETSKENKLCLNCTEFCFHHRSSCWNLGPVVEQDSVLSHLNICHFLKFKKFSLSRSSVLVMDI